jgi:hypothetical protein
MANDGKELPIGERQRKAGMEAERGMQCNYKEGKAFLVLLMI